MDLNQTDIAHFIDQLMLSATYWGWSAVGILLSPCLLLQCGSREL